jgi:DNA-binding response OmpR family regulator
MDASNAQTILVIDDEMSVQMFVTQALKNAGYQVLAAADMQEAMDASDACPTPIHLILTDIVLPSSNGMALAQALLAKRPTTPVLYMSGAGPDAIHAIQFEGAPIGGFLEKPFSPDSLVEKVRAILVETTGHFTSATGSTTDPLESAADAAVRQSADAVYRLETPVRCAQCREMISTLQAIRLLRTQVNFTSTLPRRGRVLVCPSCASVVSAELTTF